VRVWVVAAVIGASLLTVGSTVALLSESKTGSAIERPYSSLSLKPYPGIPFVFCPHPELQQGPVSCIELSDSTLSGLLPEGWPAPIPSSGCGGGWRLEVTFVDRTHLVYGPCAPYPPAIVQLREWLIQHFAPP
jgi:hypothetical protein